MVVYFGATPDPIVVSGLDSQRLVGYVTLNQWLLLAGEFAQDRGLFDEIAHDRIVYGRVPQTNLFQTLSHS